MNAVLDKLMSMVSFGVTCIQIAKLKAAYNEFCTNYRPALEELNRQVWNTPITAFGQPVCARCKQVELSADAIKCPLE